MDLSWIELGEPAGCWVTEIRQYGMGHVWVIFKLHWLYGLCLLFNSIEMGSDKKNVSWRILRLPSVFDATLFEAYIET